MHSVIGAVQCPVDDMLDRMEAEHKTDSAASLRFCASTGKQTTASQEWDRALQNPIRKSHEHMANCDNEVDDGERDFEVGSDSGVKE